MIPTCICVSGVLGDGCGGMFGGGDLLENFAYILNEWSLSEIFVADTRLTFHVPWNIIWHPEYAS